MTHVDDEKSSTPTRPLKAESPQRLSDDGQTAIAEVTALNALLAPHAGNPLLVVLLVVYLVWREVSTRRYAQAAAACIANLHGKLTTVADRLAALEEGAVPKRRPAAKRRPRARSQV